MEKREVTEEEMKFLEAVDAAIKRAGVKMDLEDLDEDMPEDEQQDVYEARFHCGTCIVSAVMEEIWPELSALMDYYEQKTP